MNIILIGMRGSGKTTVAKNLAKKLDKTFYDLDSLLAEKEQMPISEVVNKHGWDYFRDRESEIVKRISVQKNAVISTGGGVILRKKNIDELNKNGKFIFLKTSIETMVKRINGNKNRPALTTQKTLKEEIEEVWNNRKGLYEQTADFTIETDNKTIEEIVNEITNNLAK